jgi:peptide/nickel transport system substrate-binding protein
MAGGIIGDVDTLDDPDTALNPVGSGPYVLDEDASTTGSTYVLTRRDDYWDADSYPYSTVTLRVIEDAQARFNALQAGEIDAGTARANEVQSLEGAGLETKVIEATAWSGIVIMDRAGDLVPALGDVRVRRAINMAFDRDLYAKELFFGGATGTNQFYNPTQAGYDPDLDGFYEHDVDGAKDLLAEAGYADGFALTMPSTFFSASSEPAITQSLADIGITVTWEAVPPQEVSSSLSSGKYGAAWFVEGLNSAAIMTSSNLGPDGQFNPTGWTTPELTALLAEAAATPDPEEQAAVYEEINAYSVENALQAPVVYFSTYWLTKPGVDYRPNGAVPLYLSNFGAS